MFYTTITIAETETGLLYTDGRFARTLAPGRYRLARLPLMPSQSVIRIDLRRQLLSLAGQEMLTADGISVRLNVTAEYQVVDAPRAVHSVQSYAASIYNTLQVLLREEVQTRTLDALLAERGVLGEALRTRVQPEADGIGLSVTAVGVKDVVLSGEVRKMLAKEAETLREGRAALVAAREETATLRARANAAKVLAESAALLRLRELETLEKLGAGLGNTVIVALPQGTLTSLALPTGD